MMGGRWYRMRKGIWEENMSIISEDVEVLLMRKSRTEMLGFDT